MKENKAPEKIYLFENPISGYPDDRWLSSRSGEDDVEYTNSDAFIEKACAFINKANLYLYHCISEECDLVDTDKMIEDFRKYMKGE